MPMSSRKKGKDYEDKIDKDDDIYSKWEKEYKKSAARNSMSLYEFAQEGMKIEKLQAAQREKVMARAVKKATKEIAAMAKQERQSKNKKTAPPKKGKK
jgi:hypothetical protein